MENNHIDVPIWALILGRVYKPTACQLIPPPPRHLTGGEAFTMADGVAYGPMTHARAMELSRNLCGYTTLCIVPGNGVQAIWLDGLAWRMASDAFDNLLPGMTFDEDIDGVTLFGHGESFADIHTQDVISSCAPGLVFPVGRPCAKPIRHWRGGNLRKSIEWIPPDMATLEDLAPFVEFLRSLNLTEMDRANYRAAEILREAEDKRKRQENDAYWKVKREAGETIDLGGGVERLKTDVEKANTTRKLLP